MGFIAGHADRVSVDGLRWGVEPICRVLTEHGVPIAPSTYYDAVKRAGRARPAKLRDEQLMVAIARVHRDNYGGYGAGKVWLALNRGTRRGGPLHRGAADEAARPAWRPPRPAGAHHLSGPGRGPTG